MIFDPAEHEPLLDVVWDEDRARAFIARIVREADAAFVSGSIKTLHPEDHYGFDHETSRGLFSGEAGAMLAITKLARRYGLVVQYDYDAASRRCEARYREHPFETKTVVPSYFMGTVGMMLVCYAITSDRSVLDRMLADIESNAGNPTREVLWGSPGTALAALLVRERDGDPRFDDVLRAVQDELWETWIPEDRVAELLWEQDMYGRRAHYVGAGHGAIGNLAPLIRASDLLSHGQRAELYERVPKLLQRYVLRDGAAANWWSLANPTFGNRMQWCHGAAGVIIGLAAYPRGDDRIERFFIAGGEGVWKAGPVRKGPTFCHGTAGNGFALLRVGERTGDARWRRRAERFAMHAIDQVDRWRQTYGMPSFSLWTGDLGVAIYIDAVLRNDPDVLALDTL